MQRITPRFGAIHGGHMGTVGLMREEERKEMTGLSRVQWWRLEREGVVPRRVSLGKNSVGWLRHEIEAWIQERASMRNRCISSTSEAGK